MSFDLVTYLLRDTVGINGLFTVHDIHDNGLDILSEAGLPSTNLLIILTYGTATISVVCGVMKFVCFSPQKMVHLKGVWEYVSTFLICLITPFIRKCFYGLCTFHLIVNIYSHLNPSGSTELPNSFATSPPQIIVAKEIENVTSNGSIPISYSAESFDGKSFTMRRNCPRDDSLNDDYLKAMEEHTGFYLYILLSSVVPTVLLTFVSLFVTTNFKHALKAIFKYPIMIFEPLVMPFVFQGVEDIGLDGGMIKLQSKDVIEWKAGSRTMTLSMWASDVNFLNIIIDGVFGCMFAALSTELEQLCIADMLEKNAHFNILMWAGLGLKLLLHLLVLLVKIGCPETIMMPSYQTLGVLALDEGERVDTMSTSEDIEFERGPGACRQCFGRFAASIAIILGVCGTLAISVAFFVFVYGGFGIKGIKGELSDLEEIWNDYGLLLSIPTLSLFIPVSLVVWCCLRANSKSYNTDFNTNTIPRGCYSCCLRQSTAAFFLLVAAFSMILLPTGFVFAVVIAAQKEITYRGDIKINGYLMGAAMAAVMTIMVFTCLIPSCFYFLWYRGFRQGFAKSKQSWFNDLDKNRFNDQCKNMPKASNIRNGHTTSQQHITAGPMEGASVNRIDSFHRDNTRDRNTGLEMNHSIHSTGMTAEESQRGMPTPAARSSTPYQTLDSPRLNHARTMETVYENDSSEAMIPSNYSQHAPNAPPMTDSARQSMARQSTLQQNYGDIPFIVQ